MKPSSHRRVFGWKPRQSLARLGRGASLPSHGKLLREVEPEGSLGAEFKSQADQWHRETRHTSSVTKMVMHASYLRIIGMGRSILPLLFRELEERPDHWLVALNAITGQDPAPANSTFDEAVAAWLDWGRTHGYLR
jgi:hypothetical protein